jgi:hypothetical protein
MREELSRVTEELERLQRNTQQLTLLRTEERNAPTRIEQLASVLDFERVDRHLRALLAPAAPEDRPVPHLVALDALPFTVYSALVEAIPAPVFFERRGPHGEELDVPPRLAPSHSIVAWMFLTEVIRRSMSALLIARFQKPLAAHARARFPALPPFEEWNVEVTLSQGRLVRRRCGDGGAAASDRPWDLLTGVLDLARPGDSEDFGSCLTEVVEPTDVPDGTKAVAFRANSILVFVGPTRAHEYITIPPSAAPDTERYTYEFSIGPTRVGRRTLLARFAEDAV